LYTPSQKRVNRAAESAKALRWKESFEPDESAFERPLAGAVDPGRRFGTHVRARSSHRPERAFTSMTGERPITPLAGASRNYDGFVRQAGAMRIAASAALIAFLLAGCAESRLGSVIYLQPYNIENLTCAELKTRIDAQRGTINQKAELREKAATQTGGGAIGAMVYGPDQNAARWNERQYQEEYARKNCTAPPPPAPPPPAQPPPAPPK
jgi:hypothetical protein